MPIDFPNAPSVNDSFTSGATTWKWNGSVWKVVRDFAPTGATGPTGPQGQTGATGLTGVTGINWRAAWDFVRSLPPEQAIELATVCPGMMLGHPLGCGAFSSGELIRKVRTSRQASDAGVSSDPSTPAPPRRCSAGTSRSSPPCPCPSSMSATPPSWASAF
jgi:hypothetical protein